MRVRPLNERRSEVVKDCELLLLFLLFPWLFIENSKVSIEALLKHTCNAMICIIQSVPIMKKYKYNYSFCDHMIYKPNNNEISQSSTGIGK